MEPALIVIIIILFVVYLILQGSSKKENRASNANVNRTASFTPPTTLSPTSPFRFPDRFTSLSEVSEALKTEGLESSNLIIGIDFTRSNVDQGKRSFQGRSLHYIDRSGEHIQNPYQQVISIIGRTLEPFDEDKLIPAYGFGDIITKDKKVFPFISDRPCNGIEEVLVKYAQTAQYVQLSGPTSFAPIIREAIKIAKETREYHILIIVADGQVTNERETSNAIVEASNYPLSIIVIGVGDGPWHMMKDFDDALPQRKFDNFQFVDFHQTVDNASTNPDVNFALNALMEIPDQFKAIRQLHLL